MPNWWGSLSSAQAIQLGQNIFQLSQQQAQQQQELQRQQQQQERENFFTKMQLDLQRERLDLEAAKQEATLEYDDRRLKMQEAEATREQERSQKIVEYSQGLSEMITDLDFSSPEDMKKLYAYQAKYQPYGVKPEYLKPELPKSAKPLSQKEYGDLVFKTWNGVKDYLEEEYKQAMKTYEPPGFIARWRGAKDQPPELTLPDIGQVKEIVDEMIVRGETPSSIDAQGLIGAIISKLEEAGSGTQPTKPVMPQPMRPQVPLQPQAHTPLGPTAPPLAIPPAPQNPFTRARQGVMGLFNPAQKKYNALSPAEKRVADRYMADSRASLEETLQMIEDAKRLKRQ